MITPHVNGHAPKGFVQPDTDAHDSLLFRKIRSFYEVARQVVKGAETKSSGKKILIADDEPLMFQLVDEFLKEANIPCEMITACNGHDAYDLAEERLPD